MGFAWRKKIFEKRYLISLIMILAGAAALRFYTLGQKSFWYDEACSLQFSCRPLFSILHDHYLTRPLYFVVLNCWTHFFGINEFVSRLPSVIFGVCTVFVVYKLGLELFGKRTGLISAFLLATSYFHVAWSQQVRNYALLALLSAASALFYFKFINKRKISCCWAAAAFTALSFLTSSIALLLLVCQAGFLHFYLKESQDRRRWWRTVSIVCVPAFLRLVWWAWVLQGYMAEDIYAIKKATGGLKSVWEVACMFNYGGGYISQGATENYVGDSLRVSHLLMNVVFLFYYIFGMIVGLRDRMNVFFCVAWLFCSLIILGILRLFGLDVFAVKYMIFALPAYYLVVARGLAKIVSAPLLAIVLLVIAAGSVGSFRAYYNPADVASWREVAAYLKGCIGPTDNIVLVPSQQIAPVWLYYKKDPDDLSLTGNGVRGKVRWIQGAWSEEFSDQQNHIYGIFLDGIDPFIKKFRDNGADVWLVTSPGWPGLKDYERLIDYLNARYQLATKKDFSFEGVSVLHYVGHGR